MLKKTVSIWSFIKVPAYKIVSMQACFITWHTHYKGVISTKGQNDNSYYKWHRVSFKIDRTKAQYLKPQVREAVESADKLHVQCYIPVFMIGISRV